MIPTITGITRKGLSIGSLRRVISARAAPPAHLSYCKHEAIYKCFISLIASPLLHNNNPSSTAIYSLRSPFPRSLQKAPT